MQDSRYAQIQPSIVIIHREVMFQLLYKLELLGIPYST